MSLYIIILLNIKKEYVSNLYIEISRKKYQSVHMLGGSFIKWRTFLRKLKIKRLYIVNEIFETI